MKHIFTCLFILFTSVYAEEVPSVEKFTEKLQQGEIDLTLEKLKKVIKENPQLVEHRILTARVLIYTGEPLTAAKTLEEGLTQTEKDLNILWLLTQIHKELGEDGMFVKKSRGSVQYSPNSDEKKDAAFKSKHKNLALEAIDKALKINPGDIDFSREKAETLSSLGKHKEAAEEYIQLSRQKPDDLSLKKSLAGTYSKAGEVQKASETYKAILEIDPQYSAAYKFLAKLASENKQPQEAEQLNAKAEFYTWLPPFCKIKYSQENLEIYKVLSTQKTKERTDLLAKLNESKSPEALAFLAALCSHHSDHGSVEDKAFETLSKGGDTGAQLLLKLLENAGSTCTAKSAIHMLGVLKNETGLEHALNMLPRDTRAFWHMDIAEALVKYNSDKAVDPLIKMVNVDHVFKKLKEEDNPMMHQEGILDARIRALIALGHFKNQKVKVSHVIERGLKNPQLNIAALAAKYRFSKDATVKKELTEMLLANKESSQTSSVLRAFYYSSDKDLKELADSLKDEIE